MRTAIHRIDIVGKSEKRFRIRVVVLQCDFHAHSTAGARFFALQINRALMQQAFALVQMFDELDNATVVEEFSLSLRLFALVRKIDLKAFVQEGEFTQALGECVVVVFRRLHDGGVRFEGDLRPGAFPGLARDREGTHRGTLFVVLLPRHGNFFTLGRAPDFQMQFFRKRVHATDANAMQAARHFVAVGIEFATGMKLGQHNFSGRNALFFVDVTRDAATVIHHRNRVVNVDDNVNLRAVARQRFIDRIVHNLINQVVKAGFARRPDVHRGPFAHRFQTFQHFNRTGIVDFRRRQNFI